MVNSNPPHINASLEKSAMTVVGAEDRDRDGDEAPPPNDGISSASCCINLCVPAVYDPSSIPSPLPSSSTSMVTNDTITNTNSSENSFVFHPVYTHQCFQNEVMMGYRPFPTSSSLQGTGHHPSFDYHQYATSFLKIVVQLAPSCDQCSVQIYTKPTIVGEGMNGSDNGVDSDDKDCEKGGKSPKKRKLSPSLESNSVIEKDHREMQVTQTNPYLSALIQTPTTSTSASTPTKNLTIHEIINGLSKALPKITHIDHYYHCDQEERGEEGREGRQIYRNESTNKKDHTQDVEGVEIRLHKKNLNKKNMSSTCSTSSVSGNEYLYLKQPIGVPLVEYKRKLKQKRKKQRRGKEGAVCSNNCGSEKRTTIANDDNKNVHSNHDHYCDDVDVDDKNSTDSTFVLCLANGTDEAVSNYHNQVQKLSLWFIENADDVDLTSSEGGGEWKVLYLFRKHHAQDEIDDYTTIIDCDKHHADEENYETAPPMSKSGSVSKSKSYKYSLAGFMTLFGFFSPFKKPKAGIVLRICQVLILPPYQRTGHGKMFMNTVYNYAHGLYNNKISSDTNTGAITGKGMTYEIVEVNVEDPAPSCEALRNRSDHEMFQKNYDTFVEEQSMDTTFDDAHDHIAAIDSSSVAAVGKEMLFLPRKYYDDQCFEPVKEKDAVRAATLAKISKTQIHIAYEIFKLSSKDRIISTLKKEASSPSPSSIPQQVEEEIQEIEKKYRLMVKKRLNHFYSEDIGACETKDAKKKKLADIFDNTIKKYVNTLVSSGTSSLSTNNKKRHKE